MTLHQMEFTFTGNDEAYPIPKEWSHTGVVGSGDMEVLLRQSSHLENKVTVKITTPMRGYDAIWEKVLAKFIRESNLTDTAIEINDNNATPFIAAMRLKQALIEAREGAEHDG
jgi:malonate decarboxylase acyl carrier protein